MEGSYAPAWGISVPAWHPHSRPDAGNTYLTDRDQQVRCAIHLELHTRWDYGGGAVLGNYGGSGILFAWLEGIAGVNGGFNLPAAEEDRSPLGA